MNQVKIVGKLVETGVNVALDITDGKIVKLNPGREESPIWIAPPLVTAASANGSGATVGAGRVGGVGCVGGMGGLGMPGMM